MPQNRTAVKIKSGDYILSEYVDSAFINYVFKKWGMLYFQQIHNLNVPNAPNKCVEKLDSILDRQGSKHTVLTSEQVAIYKLEKL